jgi:hypothetical protein
MGLFSRRRRSRFPADMPRRLESFGRYEFDPRNSGIDGGRAARECLVPFARDAQADPDGFLAELREVVGSVRGGFVTFGAARLVWEMYGGRALEMPAALPLIDAGLDFKIARGLSDLRFTGYEHERLERRRDAAR